MLRESIENGRPTQLQQVWYPDTSYEFTKASYIMSLFGKTGRGLMRREAYRCTSIVMIAGEPLECPAA